MLATRILMAFGTVALRITAASDGETPPRNSFKPKEERKKTRE